jgi:hypothetical protein
MYDIMIMKKKLKHNKLAFYEVKLNCVYITSIVRWSKFYNIFDIFVHKNTLKNQIKIYVSIYATQGGVINAIQMNSYRDSLY